MESAPLKYRDMAILYVACLGLLALIFLNAWVCEDAYITFRVIDNFMNGYGLRWNVYERVQVYTHPLWMLLHIPVFALWPNLFHVTIALSIVCTMAAIALTLYTAKKPPLLAICFFLLPLALSKTFREYATSGLENPLSYLLFACFGWVVLKLHASRYFWFYVSLVTAVALFNRLDTIIIYAPTLAYLAYTRRGNIHWGQIGLGMVPLIAWFIFALIYYGFIFPNTKYAKLDTGMDIWLYLRQGLHYTKYLLMTDTVGALIICSFAAFIVWPKTFSRFLPPSLQLLPSFLALGIYFYCMYVIRIGGDYMVGRFWALPVFASAWMWAVFCPPRVRFDILFAVACTLLTAYVIPPLIRDIRDSCQECIPLQGRIINAIGTFRNNRLVISRWPLKIRMEGQYHFAKEGKRLAKEQPPTPKHMWYIGMIGYHAGPKLKIVDELGLADPLMARLPAASRQFFYIGHFRRNIPKGYLKTIETGKSSHLPPSLAKYYDKLKIITSGPLFDNERLRTIVLFNLGRYDFWKYEYLRNNKQ